MYATCQSTATIPMLELLNLHISGTLMKIIIWVQAGNEIHALQIVPCKVLPPFSAVNTLQDTLRNSVYPLDGTPEELFQAVNK